MKKTLLSVIALTAATAALAQTQIANFSWSNVAVGPTAVTATTVAPFNTALGTLLSVSINLTGTAVVGSATVQNQETYPTTVTVNLFGNHQTSINGVNILNGAAVTSPGVLIPGGGTASVGPVSAALGGSGVGGLIGWSPASIPVNISFVGAFGVSTDPQARNLADPSLLSSGVGTVTYTYRADNGVPEAETYVAGLALAGLVGYGFFRRSRKA